MLQLKLRAACQDTTAHGLPRLISGKPIFIRVVWLLLFLFFLCLFLRGLAGFVLKLQSRQVTSSLEAGKAKFQFPDVYACFENPMSGTYSVNMNDSTIEQLNASISQIFAAIQRYIQSSAGSSATMDDILRQSNNFATQSGYFFPQSMPYTLLADALAHRAEQSVLLSTVFKANEIGYFIDTPVDFSQFYHQTYLRCFKWSADKSPELKAITSRNSLDITLFLDVLDGTSGPNITGKTIESPVFVSYNPRSSYDRVYKRLPVSEWSLSPSDNSRSDRRLGVRVFLMPPGEYPSNFGSSFLLGPGRHHQIEVTMQEEVRDPDQFDCVSAVDAVQFLNPYAQSPYSQAYSYSYCYFDEYNKASIAYSKYLAPGVPTTWNLRYSQSSLNLTGPKSFLDLLHQYMLKPPTTIAQVNLDQQALSVCNGRERCSRLIYDARISSASWPTPASLEAFLGTTVAKARDEAISNGLTVPGLDYLVSASSGNSSVQAAAVAFARANLLKLEIRPWRMDCDRLKFSIDYGFENFVADIGGIMGIYLGMSLLTICELFDLIAELLYLRECSAKSKSSAKVADNTQAVARIDVVSVH